MKYKQLLVLSSSLLLLGACTSTQTEEKTSESEKNQIESQMNSSSSVTESMEESSSLTESSTPVENSNANHTFDNVLEEADFSNENGYQAWTDYTRVVKEYELGDYDSPESGKGSTSAEIDAMMDESVEKEEVEISDNQKMVFYRYPDEEGGEFSESSAFLAEITFYFVNDHLLFSSVTPGFYSVELKDAYEMDVLANLFTVEELQELHPQVFTVAEIKMNGTLLRQIMVPGQPLPEQTDVVLNAFYFFVREDQILHYAYLPFEEVSQDFPTSSVLLYNSYLNEINS